MMGGGSNYVSSSSNRRSERSCGRRTTRRSQERVPDRCGCGSRPVLKWSGTEANPGRPFYGCPNYNLQSVGKRWCGLFMWADKLADEDEESDRGSYGFEMEEWRMKFAWKLGKLECEVKALKVAFCLLLVVVTVIVIVVLCSMEAVKFS
ncbi:hypothetical protein Ahy_B06g085288 [Arachis hypogaea]|uniref:GRF-type domain-containing protein n=1 Tax=Arachis hypogaea TaxID=3818 RepID=A0A444YU19_ARAHY|nr:hypothetical protein Ahy_B06g085288 [Arachis hypogaea]